VQKENLKFACQYQQEKERLQNIQHKMPSTPRRNSVISVSSGGPTPVRRPKVISISSDDESPRPKKKRRVSPRTGKKGNGKSIHAVTRSIDLRSVGDHGGRNCKDPDAASKLSELLRSWVDYGIEMAIRELEGSTSAQSQE